MYAILELSIATLSLTAPGDLSGKLIPADADNVQVHLEEYSGSLRFESAIAHGSHVEEGQVIAVIDTDGIEASIKAGKKAAETAARSHRHLLERQEMAEEQAVRTLDSTRRALEQSKQSLSGWLEFERSFERQQAEQMRQSRLASLKDQRDELAQLESMYRENELTDATEELVLQRARRTLSMSEASLELSNARRAYYLRFTEPQRTAQLERAVGAAEMGLEHLLRNQQMAKTDAEAARAASSEDVEKARSHLTGLERDRSELILKAPRAGILLHGSADDYRPGGAPPRHEAGAAASTGAIWFCVVTADRYSVSVDVPESMLPSITPGNAVEITSPFWTKALTGSLRVDRFPLASSVRGPREQVRRSRRTLERDAGVGSGYAGDRPVLGQGRRVRPRMMVLVLTALLAVASLSIASPQEDDPMQRAKALRRGGIDWLTTNQNDDGSFGSHHSSRATELIAAVPGTHNAYRVGCTGLAVIALLEVPEQSNQTAATASRAIDYLLEHADVKRPNGVEFFNTWAFAYSLHAFGEWLVRHPTDPRVADVEHRASGTTRPVEHLSNPRRRFWLPRSRHSEDAPTFFHFHELHHGNGPRSGRPDPRGWPAVGQGRDRTGSSKRG